MTKILEHRIVANNALPVCHKPRRVPVTWEKDIDIQVSEMLSNGIIRPSYSPWNAPVMLVKKKDNSNRSVCDCRGVNEVTKAWFPYNRWRSLRIAEDRWRLGSLRIFCDRLGSLRVAGIAEDR